MTTDSELVTLDTSSSPEPAAPHPPRSPSPVSDAPAIPPSKPSSSRYDYIKVRIHSGPHYHVLSRYLLARRLSFTLLPSALCVHIALRIKKQCVDTGRLDLHRDELDELITAALHSSLLPPHLALLTGAILTRWRLVCSFAERRLPLLVLLLGTRCAGKSGLARRLANRLSIPSVVQTSSVLTLCNSLDGRTDSGSDGEWTWSDGLSDSEVEAEQSRRCAVVRSALEHDISKCVNEGRSLLLEGSELDCSLYSHAALHKLQHASPPPACIVLAFVLTLDSNEQRILLHDSLVSTNAPADVAVRHVERLQQWTDRRVQQQRQAWQRWKVGGEVEGELPLVPQVVPLSLRSASAAVSTMHTAVLDSISQFVSNR